MGEATWVGAVPAVLVAASFLLLPGLLVVSPLRLGLLGSVASAGVVSVATIGAGGLLADATGQRFSVLQPLMLGAVGGALTLLVSRNRRRGSDARRAADAQPVLSIALTWAGSAALIAGIAFVGVPRPSLVSQTYDNVFHLAAISAVAADGRASSLTLRTLIETDRSIGFYPSGWHSLVAETARLASVDLGTASNAAWLAVAAVAWLPGAAWLAQIILPGESSHAVAMVALPLGAVFASMPYALLTWGSLYPTFLATALLPGAMAIGLRCAEVVRQQEGLSRWRAAAMGAIAVAVAVAALVFAQPRVLLTMLVLSLPAIIGGTAVLFLRAWRAGGRPRRHAISSVLLGGVILILAAIAAAYYLVVSLRILERPIEERLSGPQALATQSVPEGIGQALVQAWPTGVAGTIAFPALLLAVAVLIGMADSLRRPGRRWVAIAYVAVVVLYALAAGSDDTFAKLLTGAWYKDRYRLSSALPVLGVTLATAGVLTAARLLRRRGGGKLRILERLPLIAWMMALLTAVSLVCGGVSQSVARVFFLPDRDPGDAVVSRQQIDFYARLPEFVPVGQRVLGDPWDGSAWTQVYGAREPVFRHVNGQWDEARLIVANNLHSIGADPAVCAALDELRVRFIAYNPHEFGGGDPAGNHFPAIHRAVGDGLFREVLRDGDNLLLAIDQCGPLGP